MDWISTCYWVAAAGAALFSALLTWQAFEHRRHVRSRAKDRPRPGPKLHAAVFVPCKGADPDLAANLRPLFEQDHADHELVFIVESNDDPAAGTVRRLMHEYGGMPARLVVAGLSVESGQKVHNLLVATDDLPPAVEVLVFVDSDVRPPRDWLRLLTSHLRRVSVTTGYRYFIPKRPTFANLVLSAINGAVLPIMFPGKTHLIWGGSWAITREAFDASGLREEWRGTLSDDLVATRVMAREQLRVVAEPLCILPSPLDVDFRGMLSFVRRQLIIGRCYTAVHWYALVAGSSFALATFWGSLAGALWGVATGAPWSWQPGVVVAALFGLHQWRARLRHDASRYYLPQRQAELAEMQRFDRWLGQVANVVGWLGLVGSALSRRIVWKGVLYDMLPGGAVTKIVRPPAAAPAAQPARRAA